MTAGGGAARKGLLRQAFTENVGLKVLALAAAIGLFVIVRGTEDAQMSVQVGVVALLPQTDRMLVSEIPDEVRITMRGSRSVLNTVRRVGLAPIQMDLRDSAAPFFYFDQDAFDLPIGADIVQIAPSAVPLRWVARSERRFRVDTVIEGEAAHGFVLGSTSVTPSTVLVRGAAPEVARMEQIRTAALDVSGLAEGRHERRVPLGPLPDHVSYVDTDTVEVTVMIAEEIISRTVADLDVAVIGASDVGVRPAQVRVLLRGPRLRVEELEAGRLVPFVDVTELEPTRGAQPAAVLLRGVPEGMSARVEPSEVLVTLPRP